MTYSTASSSMAALTSWTSIRMPRARPRIAACDISRQALRKCGWSKGVFDFHPQTLVCGLVREIGKCMNGLGVAAMRFQRLFSESPVP